MEWDKLYTFKKCPFCGEEGTTKFGVSESWNGYKYKLICSETNGGCGASTGWCNDKFEAIETWNRRFE